MLKISVYLILLSLFPTLVFSKPLKSREEYIAGIIYAEALGQSDYAKGLVATTIWVRAKGDPNKFHKVCSIPKQYTRPQKNNDMDWASCISIAKRMYAGTFTPLSIQTPSGKWVHPDHFYLYGSSRPFWARGKWSKKVDSIIFLKLGKYRTK